jgi:hypothetical protein
MSKISIMAVVLVAGLISPLGAFAQGSGHRQYIDRHRSTGWAHGTRNTNQRLDPTTRGSDEHRDNRKRQSQPVTKNSMPPTNASPLATESACLRCMSSGPANRGGSGEQGTTA